jgi:hypothetical protein
MTPPYLRHNLYEETVTQTSLLLPKFLLETIKDLSVNIERFYERLDLSILSPGCFEEKLPQKKHCGRDSPSATGNPDQKEKFQI